MAKPSLTPEAKAVLARLQGVENEAARIRGDLQRDLTLALKEIGGEAARARADHERDLAVARTEIENREAEVERTRPVAETLVADRARGFDLIAKAWQDYELARGLAMAEALREKSRPAMKAADEVQTKSQELAEARRRAKVMEWAISLYEWHFPWLSELRDADEEMAYIEGAPDPTEDETKDPVSHWLTAEEFRALTTTDRNQRALDRYLKSRKSPWQVGPRLRALRRLPA